MQQKFAVIGHPIGHTMSPFIHRSLFNLNNIDNDYQVFDIPPDELPVALNSSISELNGFNVTIPHKELIIPYLDVIDESAGKYNAVNCVKNENGKLHGYSTDAFGFTEALKSNNIPLCGNVLILGSGGAARTLAREAVDNGCSLTLAVRDSDNKKADDLKIWLEECGRTVNITALDEIHGKFDLCVNATPVGMYPKTNASPITKEQLSQCSALFDAVYNPKETVLLKYAKEIGIKSIGGMAMLVWQAVKAHEIWYNGSFRVWDVEKIIEAATLEMERVFYEK